MQETPHQPLSLLIRLAGVAFLAGIAPFVLPLPSRTPAFILSPLLWARSHRLGYLAGVTLVFVLAVLVMRFFQHLWCNEIRPRLSGTHLKATNYEIKKRTIDVMLIIADEQRGGVQR